MTKEKPLNEKRFGLGKDIPEAIMNDVFFYSEKDVAEAVSNSLKRINKKIDEDNNVKIWDVFQIFEDEFGEFTPNHNPLWAQNIHGRTQVDWDKSKDNNIQDICANCGHNGAMHSDGDNTHTGECYDEIGYDFKEDKAIFCSCKEFKLKDNNIKGCGKDIIKNWKGNAGHFDENNKWYPCPKCEDRK